MKRALAGLAVLLGAALAHAGEPDFLLRLERRTTADLESLVSDGVTVVLDARTLLLVQGDDALQARLQEQGWRTSVVDTEPWRWDYVQAGLREDSDPSVLSASGPIVLSAENWVLVRVPAGASLEPLTGAGAFLYRLPREGIAAPRVLDRGEAARRRSSGDDAPDPVVQKIVAGISPTAIDGYWADLAENPPTGTRFSQSQGCRDASTYCHDHFTGLGLTAEYQNWSASHAPNAIGTRLGAIDPSRVYVVIGHVDDLPSSGPAPGANDNASGTVNVLESARALSCWATRNTVKFIACTGEEQGLLGSDAYAADAALRGEEIRGVINMDMIGWMGNGAPNPENLDLNFNGPSEWLGEAFAAAATTYGTGLTVDAFYCPSLTASDHASFWERGYPAVCGITDNEGYCGHGGNYPYYHQSSDTIANCGDTQFFHAVVRTSVATLAELAGAFKISFGKEAFPCGADLTVLLGDPDLDTDPGSPQTVAVEVWSTSEPTPATLLLTERGDHSMIFEGTLPTTAGPPVAGDGLLSVAPGDLLHARYVDARDCDGSTGVTYVADSRVDCTGPAISAVGTTSVSDTAAKIVWTTDEPADSVAVWGPVVPPSTTSTGNAEAVAHEVGLSGLQSCTVYWFEVRSTDGAGNIARADNGGGFFHFETLGNFGAGLQPCHAGRVTIDRAAWACGEEASFNVVDLDLNADPGAIESVPLHVTSTTDPAGEWVAATETGPNTSRFAARMPLATGTPQPDGVVQVDDGDTLTVTYRDADDGAGSSAISYATASLDCTGPRVSNLRIEAITDARATVRFDTAEPGDTVVEWGTTPALGQVVSSATATTSHAATLTGFDACQEIFVRVRSTDERGNEAVADDAGQPFAFRGGLIPGLYWKASFEGGSAGWTLQGEWEIGPPGARGGSAGGWPDPAAAYNHSAALGHDLTGHGSFAGDYEPGRTEAARSPLLDATTWQRTKLIFYRQLNSGFGDLATAWLYNPVGLSFYSSANFPVTENGWSMQTYDVAAYVDGKPSVQLEFREKANNSGNYSGWNVDDVIFKDGALPDYGPCGGCAAGPAFAGADRAVDADACGAGGIVVSWPRAASWGTGGGGSYAVYRGVAPGFPADAAHLVAAGIGMTSFEDANAPAGSLYYLVRAENDESCGGGPANQGVTDDNAHYVAVASTSSLPLPLEVGSLAVSLVGDAHVRLAWGADSGVSLHRVYRSLGPEPGGFSAIGETADQRFDDLGQGADRENYFYLVRGLNACGQEGP